jgi:hypothetical protein
MAFESLFDVAKVAANIPTEPVVVDAPAQTTVGSTPPAASIPPSQSTPASSATPDTPPPPAAAPGNDNANPADPNTDPVRTTETAAGDAAQKEAEKIPASPAGTSPENAPPAADPVATPGLTDPVFGDETPEQYRSRLMSEATVAANIRAEQELLKRFNVSTVEELNAKLTAPAELTDEQRRRQNDLHRNDVMNYAVRELGMSPDDFSRAARMETLSDSDLVFEHFQKDWLEQNKDNELFKGKDLATEARYEFETLFHLNSTNERSKQLGEQSLKLSADGIRNQAKNAWQQAENAHRDYVQVRSDVSLFKKELLNSIATNLPKELQFDLPEGGKATFLTDKVNRKNLENFLRQESNFDAFMKGGKKDFQSFFKTEIEKYIAINHYKDMVATVARTAHDTGFKKGTPGAKAPFTTNTPQQNIVQPGELTEAERQKIAEVTRMR